MEDLVTRYRKQEQRAVIDAERAEAREEGREEGIGLGAEKEKQATALRLAKKGFSLEQIAEFVDSEPVVVDSWLAELE